MAVKTKKKNQGTSYSMVGAQPHAQPGKVTIIPNVTVRQDRAPKAPPAPKVATSASSPMVTSPAAGHPLTDDAQAVAARGQAIFDATQKRAALQSAATFDATDLAEAIRRLQAQRPTDEGNAKNAANSQGLASSSTIVKTLNDIATQYLRSEGDARQAYDRREADRVAQLAGVDSQGLLSDQAITAALQERQAQRDAEAAAANALAPDPNAGSRYSMTTNTSAKPAAAPAVSAAQAAEFLRTHRLVGNKWKKVK